MQNSVTTDPIGEEGLREQVSMAVDGAGFFLACEKFFFWSAAGCQKETLTGQK